jgi:8-oxo-dGTP pyrophosphatase MutT (NUDIX family)
MLKARFRFFSKKPIPHQLTSHVKLLHKVAIVKKDQVLILKRSNNALSRPGKWDLPGGNSEWPQDLKRSVINLHQYDIVREIKEETNLLFENQDFETQNLIYFATYFEPDKQIYSVNCGWAVELRDKNQVVEISKEHTDLTWITLDELKKYDFGGIQRDYETKIIRLALA